jgi:hypothetical protein
MSINRRWKGDLARPIRIKVIRPHGFLVPDPAKDPEAENKIRAENERMARLRDEKRAQVESSKLELLAKHYGVRSDDFRALALAIARDLIPGFRFIDPLRPLTSWGPQYEEKVKSGRPGTWDFDRLEELLSEVNASKKLSPATDREALARLTRKKNGGLRRITEVVAASGLKLSKAGFKTPRGKKRELLTHWNCSGSAL